METINSVDPAIALGVGLISFGINFLGTYEIQKIEKREGLKAGVASAAGVLLGGMLMYTFIENPWYMLPEMLGALAGTWIQANQGKPTIIP